MLTQAERLVVFMRPQKIRGGLFKETAAKRAKGFLCSSRLESATVTKQHWKQCWWNG